MGHHLILLDQASMTTLSSEPSRVIKVAGEIQPLQTTKEANSKQPGRRKIAAVSSYGRFLIIATLLVGPVRAFPRWVLMIITQD